MKEKEAKVLPTDVSNRQNLSDAIKQRDSLQALQKSIGWGKLQEIVNEQIAARTNKILLTSLDDPEWGPYLQEFTKGEVAGMRLVFSLIDDVIAAAENAVGLIKTHLEQSGETEDEYGHELNTDDDDE